MILNIKGSFILMLGILLIFMGHNCSLEEHSWQHCRSQYRLVLSATVFLGSALIEGKYS